MSLVDENSLPHWTDAKSGILYCDSRCFSCKCWNLNFLNKDGEFSHGAQYDKVTNDKYLVMETKNDLPACLILSITPCFFIHFAFMACIIPNIVEGIVLYRRQDRPENGVMVEVRHKGVCSGSVKSRRDNVTSLKAEFIESKGVLYDTCEVELSFGTSDGKPPLVVKYPISPISTNDPLRSDTDYKAFINECQNVITPGRKVAMLSDQNTAPTTAPFHHMAMDRNMDLEPVQYVEAVAVPSNSPPLTYTSVTGQAVPPPPPPDYNDISKGNTASLATGNVSPPPYNAATAPPPYNAATAPPPYNAATR